MYAMGGYLLKLCIPVTCVCVFPMTCVCVCVFMPRQYYVHLRMFLIDCEV